MVQIIKLLGTESRLYELVAPLVMNPLVLRKNYNFPFRTSENFIWYIALEENDTVLGFLPVEVKKHGAVINNYYIKENRTVLLNLLLDTVINSMNGVSLLSAISFLEDQELFASHGFVVEKRWTRYIKMSKIISL